MGQFPGGAVVKNLPANAGYTGGMGSVPGSVRSSGVGNGTLIQYSCLENSTDRTEEAGELQSVGSQTSQTGLSTYTLLVGKGFRLPKYVWDSFKCLV